MAPDCPKCGISFKKKAAAPQKPKAEKGEGKGGEQGQQQPQQQAPPPAHK